MPTVDSVAVCPIFEAGAPSAPGNVMRPCLSFLWTNQALTGKARMPPAIEARLILNQNSNAVDSMASGHRAASRIMPAITKFIDEATKRMKDRMFFSRVKKRGPRTHRESKPGGAHLSRKRTPCFQGGRQFLSVGDRTDPSPSKKKDHASHVVLFDRHAR